MLRACKEYVKFFTIAGPELLREFRWKLSDLVGSSGKHRRETQAGNVNGNIGGK
jgi:hypothetical protein